MVGVGRGMMCNACKDDRYVRTVALGVQLMYLAEAVKVNHTALRMRCNLVQSSGKCSAFIHMM